MPYRLFMKGQATLIVVASLELSNKTPGEWLRPMEMACLFSRVVPGCLNIG